MADAARADDAELINRRACIVGLSGHELSGDEARFLEQCRPCGLIIFSRNFVSNAQLRGLIDDAKAAAGGDQLLVLVDQEGGRVQRMRGAGWPNLPAAAAFGAHYDKDAQGALDAAELCARWVASLLRDVGINVNCAPCLDVPIVGADTVIGDRAYSDRPDVVAALGRAVALGMMSAGVVPVIKHVPGHGRAGVDSHHALPVVDADVEALAAQDFVPFTVNNDLPAAMTAHVTYSAVDAIEPASVSRRVTDEIIRGRIGFHGLLMSDDISMQALTGSIADRARKVIDAGSDVILHCNGTMHEMEAAAAAAPLLADEALVRYRRCLGIARQAPGPVEESAAVAAMRLVERAISTGAT